MKKQRLLNTYVNNISMSDTIDIIMYIGTLNAENDCL